MFAILGLIARGAGLVLSGIGLSKILDFFGRFTGSDESPSNSVVENVLLTTVGLGILGVLGVIIYKKVLK